MSYSSAKAAFEGDKVPAVAVVVAVHEGETTHWRVSEEGEIVVTVVSKTHGVPIDVMLLCHGVYKIPAVGTEGIAVFDDGEFEGDAWGIFGEIPNVIATALSPSKVLVIGDNIEIRSATGTGQKLVTRQEFLDHIHGTGVGPSATPTNQAIPGTNTLVE